MAEERDVERMLTEEWVRWMKKVVMQEEVTAIEEGYKDQFGKVEGLLAVESVVEVEWKRQSGSKDRLLT